MDAADGGKALLFAEWRYDPVLPALRRRDSSGGWRDVQLGSRALGILGLLLEKRGAVVSRESIVGAIWPTTTVEPNNLTVQIASLRRLLDEGRRGESLIQTVPGQGYRIACTVEVEDGDTIAPDDGRPSDPPVVGVRASRVGKQLSRRHVVLAAAGVLLAVVAAISARWIGWSRAMPSASPISVTMVSFADMEEGAVPDSLARALTETVASDLARLHLFGISRATVIASGPAAKDPALLRSRKARYVLRGSVQQVDTTTRLDVQLVETATGNQLWWQRFDLGPGDKMEAQRDAVRRIVFGAGPVILTAEVRRRQQKRPDRPRAEDLMLQARLLAQLPPDKERLTRERDLFERALQLDPSSIILKGQLSTLLIDSEGFSPSGFKSVLERTRVLVSDILTATPNSQMALRTNGQWLIWQDGRCAEVIEAALMLADMYPEAPQGHRWLGRCLVYVGRAEEALPSLERATRVQGSSDPWQFSNFISFGDALLDLGRFKEAINWYQRGIAANPNGSAEALSWRLSRIAIAQALDGNLTEARQVMARAQALWPYWTVRGERHFEDGTSPGRTRIRQLQDGLRLAGVRDHADEGEDAGKVPISSLQQVCGGRTSLTVPGAATLRTAEVARVVAEGKAVIIDTMSHSLGPSLPGAVGLQYVGAGGSLSDLAQDRLRQVMRDLTKGDLTVPILAVGWNSECFDGTNLVLRLVALGYRNVSWYRGGREAWEASGAPETPLSVREW